MQLAFIKLFPVWHKTTSMRHSVGIKPNGICMLASMAVTLRIVSKLLLANT